MMRRLAAVVFWVVAAMSTQEAFADATGFSNEVVERGRYLAVAADCAACHTDKGGEPYAGGFSLQSPIGTIYSSNITPSKRHGIGDYTETQFASALRQGLRADGTHLYPAMPYTSYTGMSDGDVRALYAYFMRAVAPVERAARPTSLPFPFNLRLSLAAWNALYLDDRRFAADPARDAQWNRGAYLVGALGHCGECHTPRGLLMQSRVQKPLGGGHLGEWFAPDITADPVRGIGGWKPQEIVSYLKTGRVDGKARAAGPMAEAVSNSLSRLSDDDLQAIASYLVPGGPASRPVASRSASDWGHPVSNEATLRGATSATEGAFLYSGLCASCHGASGQGTSDGVVPALFHNATVGADQADNLTAVILHGVDRQTDSSHSFMPGFDETSYLQPLTNMEVATVANYVRATFGRPGELPLTEADVALSRQGGNPSPLPVLAYMSMAVLAVLVITLASVRTRWRSPIENRTEQ